VRSSSTVTSISWIPSEAISGHMKLPMTLGIGHYDDPLPDRIVSLEALRDADRFRFANRLSAWIDVEDGWITGAGYDGGGIIGSTTANLGVTSLTFPAVAFPDLQHEPEFGDGWVRFVQTAGGRTGAGMPRRVNKPPYVRLTAPTAWTTLALTLHADGRSEFELQGASPFPRHWIYDADGNLTQKSGFVDFKSWAAEGDQERTPWGNHDAPVLVTAVETALERELSLNIMRGGTKPSIRKVAAGDAVTEQGDRGAELFLLLDGVLRVEVDGEPLAEVGPGAVLGERAILEGGLRTSTLRASTPAKLAVAAAADVDLDALRALSEGHRREDERATRTIDLSAPAAPSTTPV
jgi:hypothetical protein